MFYNFSDHSTDMNPEALISFNEFFKLYDVIVSYRLSEDSPKQAIGEKGDPCRFCLKSTPEVSFKTDAHALPHFIGNTKLFTYQECDQCNYKFGSLLETQFANHMHLNHIIAGVKGKKGYPQFKTTETQITTTGNSINWENVPDENLNFDTANKVLTVTQKAPTFLPIAVYKCLVKMAMTLIPEIELPNFQQTIAWISEEDHKSSKFNFSHLWMLQGTVETSERFPDISAIVVRRKDTIATDQPYMMFRLTYGTSIFQISIPLSKQDEKISHNGNIPYIPNLIDMRDGFGKIQFQIMNMASTDKLKGSEMTIKIKDLDGSGTVTYVDENEPQV